MTEQTIKISEIRKLTLEPGEYLFIGLPKNSHQLEVTQISKHCARWFPNNRVIVYAGSLKLAKVAFKKGEL